MRRSLKLVGGFGVFLTALIVGAMTVFACIPISILQIQESQVAPGGQLHLYIHEISGSAYPPVTFHWDGVNGPVLAVVQPTDDGDGISATATVPSNASQGWHIVVATEPLPAPSKGEFPTWGMPVRGAVYVTSGGGSAPASEGSGAPATTAAAGLATESPLSPLVLALIGIGITAIAVVLVGGAGVLAARRAAASGSAGSAR